MGKVHLAILTPIESHRRSHNVVYDTARTDLLDLAEAGILVKRKRGRRYEFAPAPRLDVRLADMGEAAG